MTRLTELRKRLARLRAQRNRLRWGAALAATALAVLWVLAAAFFLDWLLELTRLQRAVVFPVGAAVIAWAFHRFAEPWLRRHESELDMALLVQRQQHIDSDIVAAVQFESPEAPEWGSVQLEQAVVESVAERGRKLNVYEGISAIPLWRRSGLLAVTLALWVLVGALFPDHLGVFLERVALGSRHYPTRTVIQSITINGNSVDPVHPRQNVIMTHFGEPVRFEVHCSGELPTRGSSRLTAERGGVRAMVELLPDEARPGVYLGEFARLVESASYQIFLGDAWTEPGQLKVTKLPAVDLQVEVFPPTYARGPQGASPMPTGLRQIAVLEGSRVVLHLTSDKKLRDAVLTIEEPEAGYTAPLRRRNDNAVGDGVDRWVLDAPDTPLAAVVSPVRYTVQVTDEDGQQLPSPIEGVIRLQADFAPRITAAVVTRLVLPNARPTIYYRAMDDHGLAAVSVFHEVVRPDGSVKEGETPIYELPENAAPERNREEDYRFSLKGLNLRKGDMVRLTMRARDFRGPREGRVASAEPVLLEVTDEQGVLAGMMEADRHSANELQTMIERQLGVGDLPFAGTAPEDEEQPNKP